MWIINLKQMQQYYGMQVTVRDGIGQGKETKNLNVVDVLTVQERIQKSKTGQGHYGKGTREE
jgi:hypothetical protein